MRKTLYSFEKGKRMEVSYSKPIDKFESTVLYSLFAGVFILIGASIAAFGLGHIAFGIVFAILTAVDFASIFFFAFSLFKNDENTVKREEYFSVDYKYNGFTGEETNNTKMISKDEFFNKEK